MRHPIRALTIFLSVALLTSLLHLGTLAQSSGNTTPSPNTIVRFGLPPDGNNPNATFAFMLELAPTASSAAIKAELSALGTQQLYETKLNYSGIAISGTLNQIKQLRAIAGVQAVHIIPAKQRLRTHAASSLSTISLPTKSLSSTGKHVRIGIIDSGIDYTHATFGGPGTVAAFDANNPVIIEPNSFPTTKVAGGFDLAGDNYDADGIHGSVIPIPDPDPLDCRIPSGTATLNRGGHGTHVAALAAGFGVQNGETYPGPYNSLPPASAFDLTPGVAPQATLYAYKVFGCRGSTVLLGQAIARAIDPNGDGDTRDRQVDILNIAIGSSFASEDDPDAQAVDAAVAAGVTVVLAAGDNGDVFYGGSSPGNAIGAITVGALGATELADFSSRSPQPGGQAPKPDLVAPGAGIRSAEVGTGAGTISMDGTSMAAAQAAGAAAVLLEHRPFWDTAQVKGALISTASLLFDHRGLQYPVSLAGAGLLNIDAVSSVATIAFATGSPSPGGISFDATRLAEPTTVVRQIAIYNGEGVVHVVQLSATDVVSETGVTVTVPSTPIELFPCSATTVPITLTIDPAALGETPDAFTPPRHVLDRYYLAEHSGDISISSAPFARLRSAHLANLSNLAIYIDQRLLDPALVPGQVSEYQMAAPGRHIISVLPPNALLGDTPPILQQELDFRQGVDTTLAIISEGTSLRLTLVEADRIDPAEAVIQLFNGNPSGPVDIAIDNTRVANAVAYLQNIPMQPIRAGVHTVTFFQAGTNSVVAKQNINPAQRQNILVGISAQKGFAKEAWNDRPPKVHINLPYQVFPKSASRAQAATPSITTAPGQSILSIRLNNTGARNQSLSPRGSQTPLVGAFELSATSPAIADLSASASVADIQYVGITSNYSITNDIESNVLFFATSSYKPWTTPNQVEVRIYLDTTGPSGGPDGTDDYVLLSKNLGEITNLQPSDAFVSPLYRILPSGVLEPMVTIPLSRYNTLPSPSVPPSLDVAPFNSRSLIQYIGASFIGLSNTQRSLRYHIETRARSVGDFGVVIDRVPATGSLTYQIDAAAIAPVNAAAGIPNLQHRPLFLDTQGGQVQARINPSVLALRRQQAVLLLHLHNAAESQVELVNVVSGP